MCLSRVRQDLLQICKCKLTQALSHRIAEMKTSKIKLLIFQTEILLMVTPNYLVLKKLETQFILKYWHINFLE